MPPGLIGNCRNFRKYTPCIFLQAQGTGESFLKVFQLSRKGGALFFLGGGGEGGIARNFIVLIINKMARVVLYSVEISCLMDVSKLISHPELDYI